MKKAEYIPAVTCLVDALERLRPANLLTAEETRALYRVKNWLREKTNDGVTSSSKVNREITTCKARGIAI